MRMMGGVSLPILNRYNKGCSTSFLTLLKYYRSQRALDLGVRYSKEIQRGLLRVLQPPSALYPSIDFTAIRRTYNDSVARVQWRTKQVVLCVPHVVGVTAEWDSRRVCWQFCSVLYLGNSGLVLFLGCLLHS